MDPTARPRVKVCCIKSVAEAWMAIDAGAAALGLVSHMPSGPGVIRDEQVAVIGDTVSPHLAIPDTDPAALRAADSLEVLPEDPAAAAEEIQRRREEIGFSYFVFGADCADALAPVVAELAGQ